MCTIVYMSNIIDLNFLSKALENDDNEELLNLDNSKIKCIIHCLAHCLVKC